MTNYKPPIIIHSLSHEVNTKLGEVKPVIVIISVGEGQSGL